MPLDARSITLSHDLFGVRGDGVGDDSSALQAVIDGVEHTTHRGVIFLPSGRYRLTRPIYVWTGIRIIGVGLSRPVLVLGANTPGYGTGSKKYMVHFASDKPVAGGEIRDANSSTFYSAMTNVDVEIGQGNPGAVAIRFHVAQHSFLSHMDFRLGDAMAGIEEVGNQGSDLHFHGGAYGIITGKTSPGWQFLLMDSSFEGQQKAGINTEEAGLTLIRDQFRDMPIAIQVRPDSVEQLYVGDSRFSRITIAGLALGDTRNFRSQTNASNISCDGVPIFSTASGEASVAAPSSLYVVRNFAQGLMIDPEGRETGIRMEKELEAVAALPPAVPTDIPVLPPVDTWANARLLGARGDGITDDTAALQAIVDTHPTVYLPSGRYRLTSTLRLTQGTTLIGLNPITTQLMLADSTPAFAGVGPVIPMVHAPTGGSTVISGVGLSTGGINPRATALLWQAGVRSMLDDVKFVGGHGSVDEDGNWSTIYDADHTGDPNPARLWDAQFPSLLVEGGGGVFRDLWTASSFAQAGMVVRHTDVKGVIYQVSSEHHVRNEVEFHDASHWKVYALQIETEKNEGAEAVGLDLRSTSDIAFINLFIYRVSRTLVPAPAAIVAQSVEDLRLRGVHSFSGTRFAFDRTLVAEDGGVRVAAHNFADFDLTSSSLRPGEMPLPDLFTSLPQRLAGGFSNATGLAVDVVGDPAFTDQRLQHVFRWSATSHQLLQVSADPVGVVVLAFPYDSLLLVSAGKAVLRLDPSGNFLEPPSPASPDTSEVILPSGTHTGLRLVRELLAGTPRTLPTREAGVAFGGASLALLQASQLASFHVGQPQALTCEDDGITWLATWLKDGSLEAKPFIFRGGTAVASDSEGNLYIAESQLFTYDHSGKPTGVVEFDEQPTSLAFGGKDRKTLFVTTRHSLYAIGTRIAGK